MCQLQPSQLSMQHLTGGEAQHMLARLQDVTASATAIAAEVSATSAPPEQMAASPGSDEERFRVRRYAT